ncbi:hypothetical protein [Aporhodopirellula aestuarii]|uniref:LAGLIDADG homing endonuclease n=1 Tax=Aporhodopirellula aestuarii TaxID=2950107 RepID=A0ABT0TYF5_9BACT|nr:hypothetical protein [Aporhodopirellula aestuarii]MCM2369633.1 hypothetical protein [Aporhodopirellula aestuarii]
MNKSTNVAITYESNSASTPDKSGAVWIQEGFNELHFSIKDLKQIVHLLSAVDGVENIDLAHYAKISISQDSVWFSNNGYSVCPMISKRDLLSRLEVLLQDSEKNRIREGGQY